MNPIISSTDKGYLRAIIALSVIIPGAVALLLFFPLNLSLGGEWVRWLPTFNAVINSMTAGILLFALFAVKMGKIELHKRLMLIALLLGTLFLISYVIYHGTTSSVLYGDANHDGVVSDIEKIAVGDSRNVYLGILLSHIGLSIVVVPFVLTAFYFSLSGQIERHRKVVKFTFPIWLYVSVTGVIVYWMISPYYL